MQEIRIQERMWPTPNEGDYDPSDVIINVEHDGENWFVHFKLDDGMLSLEWSELLASINYLREQHAEEYGIT